MKIYKTDPNGEKIPCDLCGMEHRDDCPNRYDRIESEFCCDEGCERCDYIGTYLFTNQKGHRRVSKLVSDSNEFSIPIKK